MSERGKIQNGDYGGQLRDFTGLRWGAITPTDIDGFLDFGDKTFVFIEAKYNGAPMPCGQRLALERLTSACSAGGKAAICLVGSHQTPPPALVDYANLSLERYWHEGAWHLPDKPMTIREAVDVFRRLNDISLN